MPCDVYIYDTSLLTLSVQGIQFIANNSQNGVNLCSLQTSSSIGVASWGAVLPFPAQRVVYTVYVIDPSGIYAPLRVANLNGTLPGRLDVVLYHLSPPHFSSRTSPKIFRQIGVHVGVQDWTEEEKLGVISLVDAFSASRKAWDKNLSQIRDQWAIWLRQRGIDPALI